MPINPTPNVNAKYGAPMGRPGQGYGADPTTKFELRRIPINSGGYDKGGAYWGTGAPLYWYCAYECCDVECGPCEYCGESVRTASYTKCKWTKDEKHVHPMHPDETEVSDFIRASSREHAKEIIRQKYPNAQFKK